MKKTCRICGYKIENGQHIDIEQGKKCANFLIEITKQKDLCPHGIAIGFCTKCAYERGLKEGYVHCLVDNDLGNAQDAYDSIKVDYDKLWNENKLIKKKNKAKK